MIHAYDEEGVSLAELTAERDLLRRAVLTEAHHAADWRAAYAALSSNVPDAPALHRLLAQMLEENAKLKEQRG